MNKEALKAAIQAAKDWPKDIECDKFWYSYRGYANNSYDGYADTANTSIPESKEYG